MDYFVLWFKLDYRHQYAIWCGNDRELPDQLYNKDGLIPIFQTLNELRKYAAIYSIELVNEEPILHNLDTAKRWLTIKGKKKYNSELLPAWNLFGDIAAIDSDVSSKFETLTQRYLTPYNKLFLAENLLRPNAIHPKYKPKWNTDDIEGISKVLNFGFKLLRKSFRYKTT
ncbi:MAG: hypothetical protein KGO49_13385 [Gammaproteobacteria bacterium]|nr:hypothetical protein [Gammaproteobacteria bacterium]